MPRRNAASINGSSEVKTVPESQRPVSGRVVNATQVIRTVNHSGQYFDRWAGRQNVSVSASDIVTGNVQMPGGAQALVSTLDNTMAKPGK
jgi:hypothetical protein